MGWAAGMGSLAILLAGVGPIGATHLAAAAGPTMTLRAADDHPMDYPTTQGLKYIADTVEKRTNGRITIKIYPSAQLGAEKKTVEMTQMGALDINRVSVAPVTEFVPALNVLSLPYIFRDEDHYWKVLSGEVGQALLAEISKFRMRGLAYYDSGARSFYTVRKPIRSPADLKGLKIRVQKARVMMDTIEALGASPVPMAFEEVYSALQTGVIDGAENNPPSLAISTSHWEVAKFYSLDGHTRVPEVVLMSEGTWNKLSKEDQKVIQQAARESVDVQRRLWKEYTEKAMQKIRGKGIEVIRVNVLDFQKAMKPVYDTYRPQYGQWIDRILAVK